MRQDCGHQEEMTLGWGSKEEAGKEKKKQRKKNRPQLSSWTWQRRWREKRETAPRPHLQGQAQGEGMDSHLFPPDEYISEQDV